MSKNRKILKYTFASLAAGVVVIAPVATIVAQKPGPMLQTSLATSYAQAQPGTLQAAPGKTLLTTTIDQSNFTFEGTNFSGSATFNPPATGMDHLEVEYSQNLASAASWSPSLPTDLKNGDVFYARLAVQASDASTFEVEKNIAAIVVSGLDLFTLENPSPDFEGSLYPGWIDFVGSDGKASAYVTLLGKGDLSSSQSEGSPGLDDRLEVQYRVGRNGTWSSKLTNLKNAQNVMVRIGVKPEYANLYAIDPSRNTTFPVNAPDTAPTGQPLDYNGLVFAGDDGQGSVTYDGYNKDEYQVKFSRTSSFVSAFDDETLRPGNISDTATFTDDLYTSYNNVYKYLPATRPVGYDTYVGDPADEKPIIRTFKPFIMQRPGVIKNVSLSYNVYDGKDYSSRPLDGIQYYLDHVPNSSVTKLQINLSFKADGSFDSASMVSSDASGNVIPGAPTITLTSSAYEGGTLISTNVKTGKWIGAAPTGTTFVDPYNTAFLYIDKSGNIGTAMDVKDVEAENQSFKNGMAVTTSIRSIAYQDGSDWSDTINNDLINGEYVSGYTAGVNPADPSSDYYSKGFAEPVTGLNMHDVALPVANASMFSFQKKSGNMSLQTDQATADHAGLVDLYYSTDGINFTSDLPQGLINGDVVFVAQSIKTGPAMATRHVTLADLNVAKIIVAGVDKLVLADTIAPEDFAYAGASGKASAVLNSAKTLSSQVALQFSKTENGTYDQFSPSDLKNGDVFYARLVVKPDLAANYALTDEASQPVAITVSTLAKQALSVPLTESDFSFTGDQESGTVAYSKGTALPTQVELRYALTQNGLYTATLSSLKNSDTIYVKAFVKAGEEGNYAIDAASQAALPLTVKGLTPKILSDKINPSYFNFRGVDGSGVALLNDDVILSPQVSVVYSFNDQTGFGASPTDLSDNQALYAKLISLDPSYQLAAGAGDALPITVKGLNFSQLPDSLQASDFPLSGEQESGMLTQSRTYSSQVKVMYATTPGQYTADIPKTLKKGDKVSVILTIDPADQNAYNFAAGSVTRLELTVGNLTPKPLSETISDSDFTQTGMNESGTLTFAKQIAPQLEVQYAVATSSNFASTLPTNLSNGTTVYAKLALKAEYANDYTFTAPAATQINVTKLSPKTLPDSIVAGNFTFGGTQESGTVVLNTNKALPAQTEVRYATSASGTYSTTAPTNLKNGDKIYASLFLKAGESTNYALPNGNPASVALTVTGLVKKELPDMIAPGDFTAKNTSGLGTLSFAKTLSPQAEIQYSKFANRGFSNIVPNDLRNNDIVYAKLVVKDENLGDYALKASAGDVIQINVSALPMQLLSDVIKPEDFTFSGYNEGGHAQLLGTKKLSPQVLLQYSPSLTGPWNSDSPVNLKNGTPVYARILVDVADRINYALSQNATTPIELAVNGLDKLTLPDRIYGYEFDVKGIQETGTISVTPNKVLSPQVELQYSKDQGVTYSNVVPVDLKNQDALYIRLGIKAGQDNHYALAPNVLEPVMVQVRGLTRKTLVDVLTLNDFVFAGAATQGTLALNKTLSPQLEVQYATAQAGPYSTTAPKDLKNNDSFWFKMVLKPNQNYNYEILKDADAPRQVVVSGLAKTQVQANLDSSQLKLTKDLATGKISLTPNTPPTGLVYEYSYKDASNQAQVWTQTAPQEVDDQPISVRLAPTDAANYELTSTSVAAITLNKPDTSSQTSSLSTGTIAGIVVGAVAGALLLLVSGVLITLRIIRNRR